MGHQSGSSSDRKGTGHRRRVGSVEEGRASVETTSQRRRVRDDESETTSQRRRVRDDDSCCFKDVPSPRCRIFSLEKSDRSKSYRFLVRAATKYDGRRSPRFNLVSTSFQPRFNLVSTSFQPRFNLVSTSFQPRFNLVSTAQDAIASCINRL